MEHRRSGLEDLPRIMEIIREAQEFLRVNKVDQWQDGFPDEQTIRKDLQDYESYVFLQGKEIAAYMALNLGPEESYKQIFEGKWLFESGNYGTIHRTALAAKFRGQGLSGELFALAEEICRESRKGSLRADTHRENLRMRHLLEKNQYRYCGIIRLCRDGAKRVAYEKIL